MLLFKPSTFNSMAAASSISPVSQIMYSNSYCFKGISFLRFTNSKSCDELANRPIIRCVDKTERHFRKSAYAYIVFACASSALLMAAVEVGTVG